VLDSADSLVVTLGFC